LGFAGKNAGKYIMLDWYKRLEIALHVAQGLDYLHSFAVPPHSNNFFGTKQIFVGDVSLCNAALLST
jgi:hypothetical protein